MVNYSCSLNTVLAWTAWVLAGVCSALFAFETQQFGGLVVMFVAAGATLHVRGFIYDSARREHDAFEMGQDSVRLLR
jgi:hypothetical protein